MMTSFIAMFRENIDNIIMYVTALIINWRLHEYGHLIVANLTGVEILVGIDSWVAPHGSNKYLYMSGVSVNLLLALFGLYLLLKYSGLRQLYGFYLIFGGMAINLFSVSLSMAMGSYIINPYNEQAWKSLFLILLISMLYFGVKYRGISLKASCIFWLLVITLVFGIAVISLDRILWMEYNPYDPLYKDIFGALTITYILDLILIPILLYLNKSVWRKLDATSHVEH